MNDDGRSPISIGHVSIGAAVDVVAGVITDARGRILLARRTEGRDLAGLWEFPGGKREPGETPEAALARELHEELGIAIDIGAPLIAVPQQYPHKRLRLDVRRIASWRGTPKGLDGQALAWVPPHKLPSYAMPPADRPVVAALLQPDRYLVTPEPAEDDMPWLAALDRALDNGVRRVQLRASTRIERRRWEALVGEAVTRCRQSGAEVFVNHDAGLARDLGVGLHLRAEQLAAFEPSTWPGGVPLAASCHAADELLQAERIGCTFAVLGSLRATPSHPAIAGIGWPGFAALREGVGLPLYAIGGLGPDDIAQARSHGAQGIAAIRSLWPNVPVG
jgi:8-oxo-dGTP diphosphatase